MYLKWYDMIYDLKLIWRFANMKLLQIKANVQQNYILYEISSEGYTTHLFAHMCSNIW